MIGVLTGDIIHSRKKSTQTWLGVLKKQLTKYGGTPKQWEIYRGDSFQLEVKKPTDALLVALRIKVALKSIQGLDVRIAIGLGEKSYSAKSVTESNGSAFVHSGKLVEELKENNLSLQVSSDHEQFDEEMNLYLKLAMVFMDSWTVNAAKTIQKVLDHPDKSQEAIGKLLKINQNAVSTRLKRAHFQEVLELNKMYIKKTASLK